MSLKFKILTSWPLLDIVKIKIYLNYNQSIPYHIVLSPRFNAKIRKNIVFSAKTFLYQAYTIFLNDSFFLNFHGYSRKSHLRAITIRNNVGYIRIVFKVKNL